MNLQNVSTEAALTPTLSPHVQTGSAREQASCGNQPPAAGPACRPKQGTSGGRAGCAVFRGQ